jgi:hypothetical protein
MARDSFAPPPPGVEKKRKKLFSRGPSQVGDFAMLQPQRDAKVSSSALRQVGDEGRDIRRRRRNIAQSDRSWQIEAYDFAKKIGELGYLLALQSNVVALCGFPVRRWDEDKNAWVANEPNEKGFDKLPEDVMEAFYGPSGGRSELVRRGAINLFTGGETHLLGTEAESGNGILWEFLSVLEMYPNAEGDLVRKRAGINAGEGVEILPADSYAARCWRSASSYTDLAESEVQRVLPICQEIVYLTQMVDATIKSRISANMLFVPDELSFAGQGGNEPTEVGDDGDDEDEDPFIAELFEHMTAPVTDPKSGARLVPLVIRGKGELGKLIQVIELSRNFDFSAQELRQEALGRLAAGLDAPAEIMQGRAQLNHWCMDHETRCLAQGRGWISHEELAVGDVIMTLNHDTGSAEWQPVIDRYSAEVVDEPVLSMESQNHSSLSTGEHRWPVVKTGKTSGTPRWTTSEEGFANSDRVPVAARTANQDDSKEFTDDMVRLAAAWTSDGCRTDGGRLRIVKFDHAEIVELRRVFRSVFGDIGWHEYDHPTATADGTAFVLAADRADTLLDICDPATKALTYAFVDRLTLAQCDLLIDSMLELGDGVRDGSAITIYQVNPDRLEPLAYAATIAGYKVTTGRRNQQTGFGDIPLSWVRFSRHAARFAPNLCDQTWTTYTGTIWCPKTQNGTWLAQRHGSQFFTGNTSAIVDMDFIVKHIVPVGQLLADFITMAYLRPMLEAFEDFSEDEAMAWRVDFDPSPVIARADESKSARDLTDFLSDQAIVEANGFTKAEMVDVEERTQRRLWQLVQLNPDLFLPLLREIDDFKKIDGIGALIDAASAAVAASTEAAKAAEPRVPDPDNLVDGTTGQETPEQPEGLSLLVERLAVASDAALKNALDKSGARILSAAQGEKFSMVRERVTNVHKDRIASMISSAEFASLNLTSERLLRGAWDELSNSARSWIGSYLVDSGLDTYSADEHAAIAAHQLCEGLARFASEGFLNDFKLQPNGLRVPTWLITNALDDHLLARV